MSNSSRQLPDLDLATFRDRALSGVRGNVVASVVADERLWDRLHSHYALLRKWAPTVALIGRGSMLEAPQRHYGESLTGLEFLPPGRCLDIGSGAGFPGLVLAAGRPEQEFVLVESRQRKAAFLRRAAQAMGLSRCRVIAARWGNENASLNDAVHSLGPFAALTARAVNLDPWLDSLDKALSTDAVWLAWGAGAEPQAAPAAWQRTESVAFAGDRGLAVYRRVTRERSARA